MIQNNRDFGPLRRGQISPPVAGALFASGWSLALVAATISLGSLAALAAVAGLRLADRHD
jgi:hypothetical protein